MAHLHSPRLNPFCLFVGSAGALRCKLNQIVGKYAAGVCVCVLKKNVKIFSTYQAHTKHTIVHPFRCHVRCASF